MFMKCFLLFQLRTQRSPPSTLLVYVQYMNMIKVILQTISGAVPFLNLGIKFACQEVEP